LSPHTVISIELHQMMMMMMMMISILW